MEGSDLFTQNIILLSTTMAMYGLSWFYQRYREPLNTFNENLAVLSHVSLLPYLYMFMLGILFQRNRDRLSKLLVGKGLYWLLAYIVFAATQRHVWGIEPDTNVPNLRTMTLLAMCVVSLAFTTRQLRTGFLMKMISHTDSTFII